MAHAQPATLSEAKVLAISINHVHERQMREEPKEDFDFSQRAQWLRAAILGANDGLVSTASLMMGVGAVRQDVRAMIITGFAGLVAGACSMAIGEFVSVYSQLDIEMAQVKRERQRVSAGDHSISTNEVESGKENEENLPNPIQAAIASALAFSIGAMMPLLSASFIREHKVRLGMVAGVSSFALVVFGGLGAVLGKAPVGKSCVRVLVGGWLAMAITFGLTKLIGSSGL
ncbi:vacuolar iron transporter homolog 4-like [Telopea speciosissima]|uniref:vacuolar iron transporter homolog 4-like n=1 Tax=Telopea speciosissima TaxID=54955 RepID=UPI001CC7830B|nr:vacuolar iron transporter homolog 4-like [Telopea speciosissima]